MSWKCFMDVLVMFHNRLNKSCSMGGRFSWFFSRSWSLNLQSDLKFWVQEWSKNGWGFIEGRWVLWTLFLFVFFVYIDASNDLEKGSRAKIKVLSWQCFHRFYTLSMGVRRFYTSSMGVRRNFIEIPSMKNRWRGRPELALNWLWKNKKKTKKMIPKLTFGLIDIRSNELVLLIGVPSNFIEIPSIRIDGIQWNSTGYTYIPSIGIDGTGSPWTRASRFSWCSSLLSSRFSWM